VEGRGIEARIATRKVLVTLSRDDATAVVERVPVLGDVTTGFGWDVGEVSRRCD